MTKAHPTFWYGHTASFTKWRPAKRFLSRVWDSVHSLLHSVCQGHGGRDRAFLADLNKGQRDMNSRNTSDCVSGVWGCENLLQPCTLRKSFWISIASTKSTGTHGMIQLLLPRYSLMEAKCWSILSELAFRVDPLQVQEAIKTSCHAGCAKRLFCHLLTCVGLGIQNFGIVLYRKHYSDGFGHDFEERRMSRRYQCYLRREFFCDILACPGHVSSDRSRGVSRNCVLILY